MKLWSDSFQDGSAIPGDYAFCVIDPVSHVRLSGNKNPHFEWSDVPEGTLSFALLCHDPDVPSKGDDVNQEGKTVPASLPRVDFYHWSLFDMPPNMLRVAAGAFSDGVVARGKSGPACLGFMRHGINDYTSWFANDSDMSGDYYGYDGPCPPWNDALLHHYVFTLYALDIAQLPQQGKMSGAEVRAALEGHILAKASITGTYTLNPALAGS
jgi:Raf kinase inhibitor-like YbhB/YbcL family protein